MHTQQKRPDKQPLRRLPGCSLLSPDGVCSSPLRGSLQAACAPLAARFFQHQTPYQYTNCALCIVHCALTLNISPCKPVPRREQEYDHVDSNDYKRKPYRLPCEYSLTARNALNVVVCKYRVSYRINDELFTSDDNANENVAITSTYTPFSIYCPNM